MNPNTDPLDSQLDRLVDGELPADEYRLLLSTLDAQPQGWRRCALAFLEAQALGGELRELREEALAPKPVTRATAAAPRVQPWVTVLAMAASFLLALPLGPYLLPGPEPSAPNVAHAPPAIPKTEEVTPMEPPSPLGNVRLVTDGGPVDVPYYNMQDGAHLLLDDEGALSEAMIRSLERAGHRVERSPSIMPVDLDNGARVYLPVDNYRITPVGNRPIQ